MSALQVPYRPEIRVTPEVSQIPDEEEYEKPNKSHFSSQINNQGIPRGNEIGRKWSEKTEVTFSRSDVNDAGELSAEAAEASYAQRICSEGFPSWNDASDRQDR